MIQEIQFSGISAIPADRISPDGDLTLSLNLLNEDGALRPIAPPRKLFSLPEGYRLLCIHNPSSSVKNYVIAHTLENDSTEILFLPASLIPDSEPYQTKNQTISDLLKNPDYKAAQIPYTLSDCKTIGMTLILLSAGPVQYLLWNPETSNYRSLGSCIPRPEIDFALSLDITSRNTDGEISLINATDIQTPEASWQHLRDADLSGDFENQAAHRYWHLIHLTELDLKKGEEYRFTFNRFGLYNVGIVIYTGDIIYDTRPGVQNNDFSNPYGSPYESQLLLHFSYSETSKKITAEEDIDSLWICVSAITRYTDHTITLTIEKGLDNLPTVETKIISYTPEAVNAVAAAMNLLINEEAMAKNRFIFPFFVRYALRLYDGSSIRPSAPRLMIPNSEFVPVVLYREEPPKLQAFAFTAKLQFRINDTDSIADWKDIVTGIDIFVSPSAWPYDQGVEYDKTKNLFSYLPFDADSIKDFGIGRFIRPNYSKSYLNLRLLDFTRNLLDTTSYQPTAVRLGARSQEEFFSKFTSAEISRFHLISSIEFDDITPSDNFTDLDIQDNTLSSLDARPLLEEAALPYDGFADAKAHIYNNRLHLFDASIILPSPQSISSLNPLTEFFEDITPQQTIIRLSTSEGDRFVKADFPTAKADYPLENLFWFFYPDSRAKEATLIITNPDNKKEAFTMPLKSHPFLNGAYALVKAFDESLGEFSDFSGAIPDVNNHLSAPSSIYISEINNPFLFRNASVVSVGASSVHALSSAARPLSQGQFGQFPLYAFTDEGIWAMEISATGAYSARQPITRDVCTNPSAITQIDAAVLFPSARGIMLLSGSQTQCLSDIIASEFPFDILTLPAFKNLLKVTRADSVFNPEKGLIPFSKFISSCSMIYDYPHQRIILSSTEAGYAFLYSLRSKLWGMINADIVAPVNAYPEALAADKQGNIISFSGHDESDPTQTIPAILLTRPLKFSAPDLLKTIDTIIARGEFDKGAVNIILYGSRNLRDWHPVSSSKSHALRAFRGSPYKYFRILLLCRLNPQDSLHGASVSCNPRLTNRLR